MGYTHYWYRQTAINPTQFGAIAEDFGKIVLALDDLGVKLADGHGKGAPTIESDAIIFNGSEDCGHPKNSEVVIPWPAKGASGIRSSLMAEAGSWFAGTLLSARCCNGDCSYETFAFPRTKKENDWAQPEPDGLLFDCCKTAYRPYDIAVTAFLIIAKRHLGMKIRVSSDGEDEQWQDARQLCEAFLGYGMEFHLNPANQERLEALPDFADVPRS